MDRQGNRRAVRGERCEVDGVAGATNSASDGRVHRAVGELGCTQSGGDRLTEHRRNRQLMATGACEQDAELAVIAEPAARTVDRVDDALDRGGCALEVLGIGDDNLHEGPERGSPVRSDGHEAPLTVLADDELPVLAEPVASGAAVLVAAEGVAVLDAGVVVMDVVDVAVRVPACVCAESAARATTATVPAMPDETVSFFRNLSARSRSATVILFTHLRMSTCPGARVRDSWANPGNPCQWPPGLPPPWCLPGSYVPEPPIPGHEPGSVLLVTGFGFVDAVSFTVVGWTAIRTGVGAAATVRVRPTAVAPVVRVTTCWWDAGRAAAVGWLDEANPAVPSSTALTPAATTNEPAAATSLRLIFIMPSTLPRWTKNVKWRKCGDRPGAKWRTRPVGSAACARYRGDPPSRCS